MYCSKHHIDLKTPLLTFIASFILHDNLVKSLLLLSLLTERKLRLGEVEWLLKLSWKSKLLYDKWFFSSFHSAVSWNNMCPCENIYTYAKLSHGGEYQSSGYVWVGDGGWLGRGVGRLSGGLKCYILIGMWLGRLSGYLHLLKCIQWWRRRSMHWNEDKWCRRTFSRCTALLPPFLALSSEWKQLDNPLIVPLGPQDRSRVVRVIESSRSESFPRTFTTRARRF